MNENVTSDAVIIQLTLFEKSEQKVFQKKVSTFSVYNTVHGSEQSRERKANLKAAKGYY